MEPRWRAGVWLGRRWGAPVRQVFAPEDGRVHQVRAAQRRPVQEWWPNEAAQLVTAVPRAFRQLVPAGVAEPA